MFQENWINFFFGQFFFNILKWMRALALHKLSPPPRRPRIVSARLTRALGKKRTQVKTNKNLETALIDEKIYTFFSKENRSFRITCRASLGSNDKDVV